MNLILVYCLVLIFIIILIEYILRLDIELYSASSGLNVKKIPRLTLDRNYEFIDPSQDRVNWEVDSKLGWILKKNSRLDIKISIPGLNVSHKFSYETDSKRRRRSSIKDVSESSKKKTIAIYGCSFTFGHSLSDNQTYSWLLQKKFNEKNIYNYAVAGYSLFQSLLVLEKTILIDKPEIVVIGFHPDLGWRNTCSINWVERLQNTWKIPSCVSRVNKLIRYKPKGYLSFGSNLRIIKVVEKVINKLRFYGRGSPKTIHNTMEHLLLQIQKTCQKNSTKLLIACIDESSEYYNFLDKNNFDWCITGVNTTETNEKGVFKWISFPFDNHPNELAHKKYAKSIEEAIRTLLKDGDVKPKVESYSIPNYHGDRGQYVYPHS
jgi:hypothetical protein